MACNQNCSACGGGCGGCGSGGLALTREELQLIQLLCQIPFLPVVRKSEQDWPVLPGQDGDWGRAIIGLWQQRIIDLDYSLPVSGFDYSPYRLAYPEQGSMALTNRGQKVAEQIEILGIEE